MFDPGFRGNGTLELVNLSPKLIVIRTSRRTQCRRS
jgi:deoxycytidine triphosphate deaminase